MYIQNICENNEVFSIWVLWWRIQCTNILNNFNYFRVTKLETLKCCHLNDHPLTETLITTDMWHWVVWPKLFTFDQNIYKYTLLAHLCIIPYILLMPSSPSKIGGSKNFRKQSDKRDGEGHKTLISRRRLNFLGKGSKDLAGRWKLHNLNYIRITLKLCKIYAY